ncbi:hypothetical protein ACB283_14775 [Aeromonas caviae]
MSIIRAGLCLLLLPLATMAKDHPTAECSWLYKRIEILETAIRQGDELGTREVSIHQDGVDGISSAGMG